MFAAIVGRHRRWANVALAFSINAAVLIALVRITYVEACIVTGEIQMGRCLRSQAEQTSRIGEAVHLLLAYQPFVF